MPFVPAVGVVKAEFNMIADGQKIVNIHYFEAATGVDPFTMAELGAELEVQFVADWATQYPNTVSLTSVVLTDQAAEWAPGQIYTSGMPIAGSKAGTQLPNNVALCITKHTGLRGRSFRGRTYFGPLTETDVTGHVVSAAFISGLMSRMQNLQTITTTSQDWFMCIVSRQANLVPRVEAEVTRVSSFSTDGYVDSQRRRLPGRGQ